MTVEGLGTVIYKVADLPRAKAWYSAAFQHAPYFDEPFYVGFNIGGLSEAQDIIEQCATDPSYVYMADGGTELAAAFQAIATNVSQLRLSK